MSTVALNPEVFIRDIRESWDLQTASQKLKLATHARAWATVFYYGVLPLKIETELKKLEAECR